MFENKGLLLLYKQSDGYKQKIQEFIKPYITDLIILKRGESTYYKKNGNIIFCIRESIFNPDIYHCDVNYDVWVGLTSLGVNHSDMDPCLRDIVNDISDEYLGIPHIYFSIGYHGMDYEFRDCSSDSEDDDGFEVFYFPKITSKNDVEKKGKQNKISNSVHAPPW